MMQSPADVRQASDRGSHPLPDMVGPVAQLVDAVIIVLAGLVSRIVYREAFGTEVDGGVVAGVGLMVAFLFTTIMRGWDLYETGNLLRLERQLKSGAIAWLISFGMIVAFAFLLKTSDTFSRGAIVVLAVTGFAAVAAHRCAWRYGLPRAMASGAIPPRRTVVLTFTSWEATSAQVAMLKAAGLEIAQSFFMPADEQARAQTLDRVIAATRDHNVDEVVVMMASSQLGQLDPLLDALRPLPLPIRLVPDAELSAIVTQPSRRIGSFAIVDMARAPLGRGELYAKRALDVLVAGTALLLAAPLLVVAMAAIKMDSRGPVLFRQTRRGFNGRSFKILKLRTMSVMEDGDGLAQARKHDPRVTTVGRWLRRTSIDELPQLWNVLRGEMSVVGPRPHAVAHDHYYDTVIENYAFRQHVKPGLTGWAQVKGHRGETPRVAMMAARIEHDIWYINNWTFLLDVRIMILTCTKLFARAAY